MESPESRIVPTEDMNTVQLRISGEGFPEMFWKYAITAIGHYNVLITKVLSRPARFVEVRCL